MERIRGLEGDRSASVVEDILGELEEARQKELELHCAEKLRQQEEEEFLRGPNEDRAGGGPEWSDFEAARGERGSALSGTLQCSVTLHWHCTNSRCGTVERKAAL